MTKTIWIAIAAVAVIAFLGLISFGGGDGQPATAGIEPAAMPDAAPAEIAEAPPAADAALPDDVAVALDPETYDPDMVAAMLDASSLDETIKTQLAATLEAAEAGEADLGAALDDIRTALAAQ